MFVDGEVGVAQLADGRLVCGGTKDHDDTAPPVVDATVARLRAAMTSLVPEAGDLEVSHVWSCFRPRVADDFPVIDALPRTANAFFVGGMFSTGLLMAPAVGEIVTEWITTGRAPEAARAFGLSRDGVCA
jgi:glycine oxidase